MSGNKGNAEHAPLLVIASGVFRWLGLHMSHEPDERSVKLLVRKGRKKRKGKAPRKSGTRCRSTIMRWDETEKRVCSAWMRGPSATTRRKARRARSEEHTSELQSL